MTKSAHTPGPWIVQQFRTLRRLCLALALVGSFFAGSAFGHRTDAHQVVFVEWRTPPHLLRMPRIANTHYFGEQRDRIAAAIPASALRKPR